jgi:hypothetical protein
MHGTGQAPRGPVALAVAVVDQAGRVSHWGAGARRLFGPSRRQAVGRPATDLLPVGGALDGAPYPAAGRARVEAGRGSAARIDVLWWAYPLAGPGSERLLVLAADTGDVAGGGPDAERIAPAFGLRPDTPGGDRLARGLPGILPGMSVGDSSRVVDRVRELGYPVVEFDHPGRPDPGPGFPAPRGPL